MEGNWAEGGTGAATVCGPVLFDGRKFWADDEVGLAVCLATFSMDCLKEEAKLVALAMVLAESEGFGALLPFFLAESLAPSRLEFLERKKYIP